MTTIGYATLQIIPSLKGVTEAIEQQVEGKVVNVSIGAKVDQPAAEKAGKQARETVEKHTKQVKVEPKVDQNSAKKAGKQAGDVVTKEVNDAVRKGDIGKTVGDEIASTAKSSAGKQAAKAIVDGIADGVKGEMPRGGVGEAIVDGIADGVKQGIDGVGIGGQVVDTIRDGVKSGNLGGAIKDAVVPAINNIGKEIRAGAASWAGDIADSLRSGDIQGATTEIGDTVQNTTDLIADIGSTFGLQLDGVRDFGTNAKTVLSNFGTDIQGVINTATGIKGTFNEVGTLLETVLPGKAGAGAAGIARALGSVAVPAWLLYLVAEDRSGRKWGNGDPVTAIPGPSDYTPGQRSSNEILYGPYVGPFLDRTLGITPPAPQPLPPMYGDQARGRTREQRGYGSGGYTGSMPVEKIAGVVHGGEYVINASATAGIENAYPGLLDFLNKKGALPGYAAGGLVAGTSQLRDIITQQFGVSVGGWRPEDQYGEHSTGRALDVMTSNKATGDAVKDFAINNASAIDLKWAIWQQKMWYPNGTSKAMKDRGSPTQNHMDHVHIFSGTGIINGLRGSLAASSPEASIQPASNEGDASAPSYADQSSASTSGMTTSSQSNGNNGNNKKFNLSAPSSLSGIGSWAGKFGGDQLTGSITDSVGGADKLNPGLKTAVGGLGDLGTAAGSLIDGQVASAMSVFGVDGSPGWLKGLSTFVSGISIGGPSNAAAGGSAPAAATPMISAAPKAAASMIGGTHSGSGAQPGPGVTYNIRTATVEDAYLQSQRIEKERVAAQLARY